MKKVVIVFLAILLLFSGCKSKETTPSPKPEKVAAEWANSYNFAQFPNETNGDILSLGKTSIAEADDDGYIVAGTVYKSSNSDKKDIFLLKVNSKGTNIWAKRLSLDSYKGSPLIKRVSDGYILIFESSPSMNGDERYILVKFDKDFNIIRERSIKMSDKKHFVLYKFNIIQAIDKEYIVLLDGDIDSSPGSVILKMGKTGDIEWERDFKEHIASIDNDGNNIVLLTETNLTNLSFSVLRFDGKGNELFARSYSLKDYNKTIAIKKSVDGGYFILGYGTCKPSKDGSGIIVVNGKEKFKFPNDPELYKIAYSDDGSMLILRKFEAIGIAGLIPYLDKLPIYGIFVMKSDKDGNVKWTKVFGERSIFPSYLNYFNPILSMSDGGSVVSLTAYSTISTIREAVRDTALVFRLDQNGSILWAEIFQGNDIYTSTVFTNKGFIVSGKHNLLKFNEDGNIGTNCKNIFKLNIDSKEINAVVEPGKIAIASSVELASDPIKLETSNLDLPEVTAICDGE